MMKKVFFIGAGPGDPELLTLKGKKLIDNADVIIYAGSLVNPLVYQDKKDSAIVYNSAQMSLPEVLKVMVEAVANHKSVVRIHTGDPSIYGAIQEQMDFLLKHNIEYEVVPGVSSFTASAAAIKREFTLPGVTQTVICTRLEGRTPVPKLEQLELLASHQASMAIFLSVQMIDKVVKRLTKHYGETTPVAVVERATWPNQKIVIGTLANIAAKVKEANITRTAQILVGDFIDCEYQFSKLYDENFSHMFREAK
ncbi:precorrin-4 C(11)-methyltransferase [Clostridium sp. 'deep sea']|uniref:precorrin-4 C(11)-methyltransferase n=1 Tax=Clostridium sp. 'deep sea' TaxID=2779445 RepID=UPI001A9BA6F3|nr:precorrin-4 C(11)-methyltransferase [Clostridium sp. 'deep sea']